MQGPAVVAPSGLDPTALSEQARAALVETLLDAGKPWSEADSLWARTGVGVFEPDLAQRVIRGELRR